MTEFVRPRQAATYATGWSRLLADGRVADQILEERHAASDRIASPPCQAREGLGMPVPQEYVRASPDFERFMLAARDALGHATTHQTYYSVLAVFTVFRRRVGVADGLRFADALPPVLRAIFVSDWDVEEARRPFGSRAEMTEEAQAFRREHSFTPDDAIAVVARVLRDHVDRPHFERMLRRLPVDAGTFWDAEVAPDDWPRGESQ